MYPAWAKPLWATGLLPDCQGFELTGLKTCEAQTNVFMTHVDYLIAIERSLMFLLRYGMLRKDHCRVLKPLQVDLRAATVSVLPCRAVSHQASSQRWQRRQQNDKYAREARLQGFKSRAAFKLLEVRKSICTFIHLRKRFLTSNLDEPASWHLQARPDSRRSCMCNFDIPQFYNILWLESIDMCCNNSC